VLLMVLRHLVLLVTTAQLDMTSPSNAYLEHTLISLANQLAPLVRQETTVILTALQMILSES
jgi:hypothetical protein